jgi:hypothetical protein
MLYWRVLVVAGERSGPVVTRGEPPGRLVSDEMLSSASPTGALQSLPPRGVANLSARPSRDSPTKGKNVRQQNGAPCTRKAPHPSHPCAYTRSKLE